MRTLTTVMMAGIALMMAGCSSYDMMDKPMNTKMASMEDTMDPKPMDSMEETSAIMMKGNSANDTMMKPAADTMTETMQ
ncbi:hypothetical protein [Desulfopila aestuarii]|uniref:Uncharacterized protein n=1 Tax=Desulfopila aestuarii DSM 18488 TaxID=1121416 RepID=A0A1M7Y4K2_9BACT|nr:hypothetical protein [Desulfopila aestuarii]SHO47176.1 hypothetical protein SAMN02745220_01770 [Desulfopila aestuarii DSM 18488]